MKKGSLFLLLPVLFLLSGKSPDFPAAKKQFVLFDVEFTYTKEDAMTSKPSLSHYYVKGNLINNDRPKDWTAPVDYRNGTAHLRLEVIEKGTNAPTKWSICYIPNKGQGNGYGCASSNTYGDKGVYDTEIPMTSFWENEAIIWTEGVKQMDLVIKDANGKKVHLLDDPENFVPTKVRFTMIQVAAGEKYDPKMIPKKPKTEKDR